MKIESTHNEQIDILIIDYLSNQIEPIDKEFLLKWMNESEENYRHFANLKNIWDNTHTPFSADDIDADKAYEKMSKKIHKPRMLKPILWLARIAAIIVISTLSITIYQYLSTDDMSKEVFQEIHAPYGTFSNVELPDGSIVYLHSGSQLRFSVHVKKGERVVEPKGRACF